MGVDLGQVWRLGPGQGGGYRDRSGESPGPHGCALYPTLGRGRFPAQTCRWRARGYGGGFLHPSVSLLRRRRRALEFPTAF